VAELVYKPVIGLAKLTFRILDMSIDITGKEHLPATGGAVLAMNHVSYADFVFVGLAGVKARPQRLVRFMAKEEVFAHRVSGPLMRGMKHISVDRSAGASAFQVALEAVRSGEVVGVFPEATISRSLQLKDFKYGAARMAIDAGVPLIPCITWGGQRLLPKGRRREVARHLPITVAIGPGIRPEPSADPSVVTKELRETMTGMLETVQATYPDQPRNDADRWWLPAALGGTAPTPEEAAALDAAAAEERRRRRLERARRAH
jgi:1-acyl-sn-glycerol-3-phosphate acyltransferase